MGKILNHLAHVAILKAIGCRAMDDHSFWNFLNPEAHQSFMQYDCMNSLVSNEQPHYGFGDYQYSGSRSAQDFPSSQVFNPNTVEAGSHSEMFNPTQPHAESARIYSPQFYQDNQFFGMEPTVSPVTSPESMQAQAHLRQQLRSKPNTIPRKNSNAPSFPSYRVNKASTTSFKTTRTSRVSKDLQAGFPSSSSGTPHYAPYGPFSNPIEYLRTIKQDNTSGFHENVATSSQDRRDASYGENANLNMATMSHRDNLQDVTTTTTNREVFNLEFDWKYLEPRVENLGKVEVQLRDLFCHRTGKPPFTLKIREETLLSLASHINELFLCRYVSSWENAITRVQARSTLRAFNSDKWTFFALNLENWRKYFSQKRIPYYDTYDQLSNKTKDQYFKTIFTYYLCYVEMISAIIVPEQNGQVMEHGSVLANACHLFWRMVAALHNEYHVPEGSLLAQKITAINHSSGKSPLHQRAKNLRQRSDVWTFVEYWLVDSRPGLLTMIKSGTHETIVSDGARMFFNNLFGVLVEDLTRMICHALKLKLILPERKLRK